MKSAGRFLYASFVLLFVLMVAVPSRSAAAARRLIVPSAQPEQQPAAKAEKATVLEAYGRLPLHFEANRGQTDQRVKFLARTGGNSLFLTSTEAYWRYTTTRGAGVALRMKLVGSNPAAPVRGQEELTGRSNYFIGNDPSKWRSNVPQYGRVEYQDIYPGVKLVYHGTQRQLEYDFVVSPGADPGRITLRFDGASSLEIDRRGDLVLHTAAGDVRQKKPSIYQQIGARKQEVGGGYALDGKKNVRFELAAYDPNLPLVIDPLVYSTYLGGSGGDDGEAITIDSAGNAYVTGATASIDFPTTMGAYSRLLGNAPGAGETAEEDAFVTKLNPAGTALVFSTYLGGNDNDQGNAIVVDASGNVYVAGKTVSSNFPVFPGTTYQPTPGTNSTGEVLQNGFVTKLNPTGSALVYSTYLHRTVTSTNIATALIGLAVFSGNAYVGGNTDQISNPDKNDCYVAVLNATGSALVYSYTFGGTDDDELESLFVDGSGSAYIVGETNSTDFPTTAGAFQMTFGGDLDGFLLKLNPAGSAAVFSTYLGGSGNESAEDVAVDASGNIYVLGNTSGHFPTTPGAYRTTPAGGRDAFVLKLNPAGSALVYSTYLGGSHDEFADALALDSSGNVYITGSTLSSDFPTTLNALQRTFAGGTTDGDAFVSKLDSTGTTLLFSTYLGGKGNDYADAIALDPSGNVYITGNTVSADFPITTGAFQTKCGTDGTCNTDKNDAFITKIDTRAGVFASVSAASFAAGGPVAPDSIVAGFGADLAPSQASAPSLPLPTILNGTQVEVSDSLGATGLAPLFYVSPGQIDYLLPSALAAGPATVTVTNNGAPVATGTVQISRLAPSLFTANSSGKDVPAGQVLIVKSGGKQVYDLPYQPGATAGTFVPKPIDLTAGSTYLILYGTGFRNYMGGLGSWKADVGGVSVPVVFAGGQPNFAGLDQVNIGPLPNTLAGKGTVNLVLTVESQTANTVTVAFK